MNTSEHLIALIAGNGSFPMEFCQNARERGYQILTIALGEEANPELQKLSNFFHSIKIGEFGKLLKLLNQYQVKQVAFAGGIKKIRLYDGLSLDLTAMNLLAKARTLDDDVILRKIAEEIEKNNITVIPATSFLTKSVPKKGLLSKRAPSSLEIDDLNFGFPITKGIGELDLGQSIVVAKGMVVAVEAVDGTDATILRGGAVAQTAGTFKPGKGAVLIKLSKPQQDLRFDLPTIGPVTVENCYQAGITAIFIEAEKSLILDFEKTIELTNKFKIALQSV